MNAGRSPITSLTSMNEITRNLWIGNFPSALSTQLLKKNNIHSVLSVMRGKIKINETLIHLQIELDDSHEADILSQFLPAIQFIEGELEKGRGVLVHCLAGISRSPTIVAAYLIYTLKITPDEAVGMILKERPFVEPNSNFYRQLNLFYDSQGKVSRTDKDIRRFYLERTVHEVTSGDGSRLATEMLSDFPNPSNSGLATQARSITSTAPTFLRQRRIRCKMCRHDLATREHLLDHGQLGPSDEKPSDCRPQINSDHTSGATAPQKIDTGREDSNAEPVSIPEDASNTGDGKISDPARSEPATSSNSVEPPSPTRSKDPSDIASELYTKLQIGSPSPSCSPNEPSQQDSHLQHHISPKPNAILINPKCSGYFVEPMKWMDHFLSAGSLSGKITCPTKKCNAKLGNYDWAGVCCGCKIWITPGFCINRSKVDEVV